MSQRLAYLFCFMLVVVILATGYYIEYALGILPCPLCTLQRITFAISGIIFFIGIFACRKRLANITLNLTAILFAIVGILLAGRQIWIQSFPNPDNSECGVSINYMLTVLPISDVAQKIFSGSAECSQRGFEFLALNLPEWSLLFFSLFFIISAFYLLQAGKR